jgi:hypothetical protein
MLASWQWGRQQQQQQRHCTVCPRACCGDVCGYCECLWVLSAMKDGLHDSRFEWSSCCWLLRQQGPDPLPEHSDLRRRCWPLSCCWPQRQKEPGLGSLLRSLHCAWTCLLDVHVHVASIILSLLEAEQLVQEQQRVNEGSLVHVTGIFCSRGDSRMQVAPSVQ